MKDSQQVQQLQPGHIKYIKANNERFSTQQGAQLLDD